MNLRRSCHLLTEGGLPGWAGLLVLLVVGWLALRNLNRELADVRPSPLRLRVLPALRLLIVGLFVWLLCQPVLKIESRWEAPPRLLALVDSSNSMNVNEELGSLHRKIDVLEKLGESELPQRDRYGSRLASAVMHTSRLLAPAAEAVRSHLAAMENGLPLSLEVFPQIAQLGRKVATEIEALAEIQAMGIPQPLDKPAAERLARIAPSRAQVSDQARAFLALLEAIVTDSRFVATEGRESPALVTALVGRVESAVDAAEVLTESASALQAASDVALLREDTLRSLRAGAISRLALAEKVGQRVIAPLQDSVAVEQSQAGGISAALERALRQHLASSLWAVLLVSDGSSGLDEAGRLALHTLSETGPPVHTVLVGLDGQEPEDAGIVGVEMPSVAVRNQPVAARVLVKDLLASGRRARLVVRTGDEVLAEEGLDVESASIAHGPGYGVVEVSLTIQRSGRHQLVFEAITPSGRDAYVGNERWVGTVDVLPEEARVLLVCDRLLDEFAAFRDILNKLPFADLSPMLAAPEIPKFETGSGTGVFPATQEDWQQFALVVLLGGVPDELREPEPREGTPPPIEALRQSVENGLHAYVHDTGDNGERSWATALGLATTRVEAPGRLCLDTGIWPDLYQVGVDPAQSISRWALLGNMPGLTVLNDQHIPLLPCQTGSLFQVVPRGQGLIVHSGLRGLTGLRNAETSRLVNRLIKGILTLALRPFAENADGLCVFPPQPVQGRPLRISGPGADPSKLVGLRRASGNYYEVTDPDEIAFEVAGVRIERQVHKPLSVSDFKLAPRAQPLREISELTGGHHVGIEDVDHILPVTTEPAGVPRLSVSTYSLWNSRWWPLALLLVLVSAEYLLRRRVGRVM